MLKATEHLEQQTETQTGPATAWLGAGALLAGVGTVLLGPLLPHISTQWHLTDSNSGLLLFAKFVGAFLGGATVLRRLRSAIFFGTLLSCAGFTLFGFSTGLVAGCAALFVSGLGLGQLIASTNILAGRRYRAHTGSALASLNFFWSLGAIGAGLVVAAFLPSLGFLNILLLVGAAFLVVSVGGYVQKRADPPDAEATGTESSDVPWPTLLRFGALLFLYGGLETCLSGWLTTYTRRYASIALLGGQSGTVLLWVGITAGRALSSAILRFVRESVVQRIALVFTILLIAALATTQRVELFSAICLLLGASLAPFFPATFAIFMRHRPVPRAAGIVLAVSGLGAAAFPWLMGILSTHTSLRLAMVVPAALAFLLLLVSAASFETTSLPVAPILVAGEYSEKIGV